MALVLAFLYVPLLIVVSLSFNGNERTALSFPPERLTTRWWGAAFRNPEVRHALWTSVRLATVSMLIAIVLGTMAAFAVQRFRFFGRNTVSFLVVLPIALPGIVTGIALNRAFRQFGVKLGFTTLVAAHATFCIVVVYNNTIARLRRMSPNIEEASADLGAHTFQTFRHVTFPLLRSALLAGGLLAFALSFDEIVVTTFASGGGITTLPQWILERITRSKDLPVVNVVAVVVVLASLLPVYVAQRLTDSSGDLARTR
jgi:putative spermidine/putrescine transport system permease protein